MKELRELYQKLDRLDKTYKRIPHQAGIVAVRFSKERFRDQAWLDKTKHPWPKRKRNEKGKRGKRGVLIDTGKLKRSIRRVSTTATSVTVGTDVPYAQIHNDGGQVNTTARIPKHRRSEHTRRRKGRTEQVKAHTVKAHTRHMNFKMPQRQFLGRSYTLERRIELRTIADIRKALKNV